MKRSPQLLPAMKSKIDENRHNLLFYMLFLRLSPLFPNWAINLSSPILGIPLSYFGTATLIGKLVWDGWLASWNRTED